MKCAICKKTLNKKIIDLGSAPITNNLLKKTSKNHSKYSFPLQVHFCSKCWLVQNKYKIDPKKIFKNDYPYFSSFSSSWVNHARVFTNRMIKKFKLDKSSLIAEVASNDGYLLQFFKRKNIPCYGIEPTKSTAKAAKKKGIKTYEKFFNIKTAKILSKNLKADLIIANNVLAHVPDLGNFIKSFKILLKDDGLATFEFHYLVNLIKKKQFDTIYHEHYFYHSLISLNKIFKYYGLKIFDAEKLKSHGGSLRIFVKKIYQPNYKVTERLKRFIDYEYKIGVNKIIFYKNLQSEAFKIKNKLVSFLNYCNVNNFNVIGYGAAAKGITLINFSNINSNHLKYIIDKNPKKQNKFLPQSNIKIVNLEIIKKIKPKFIIILPWNLKKELIKELKFIRKWGGKFVVFVPSFKIY